MPFTRLGGMLQRDSQGAQARRTSESPSLRFTQLLHLADTFNASTLQFGVYEWCMTDTWDPKIPHHKDIAHRIEVGDGIAEMRNINACRTALQTFGFEILHEDDLADRDE